MAHINLLPWREERRKELQQEFYITMVIAALLGAILWGGLHFYHAQLIAVQNTRLTFIQSQIAFLDKQLDELKLLEQEKEKLLARISAIERLQITRPLIVRLFDEIVSSLPDGLSLNDLKQQGSDIEIKGVAQSNARVSSFMRNITSSEWIANPRLNVIKVEGEERLGSNAERRDFILKLSQVIPKLEEDALE